MNDTHLLKISGKAELPKAIDIGHNFHCSVEGSVVSVTKSDNENGEFTYTYTFKPVKIDLLNDKGEMLKLKDTRGFSQLFRARLWALWKNGNYPQEFETWYQNLGVTLLQHSEDLIEMYAK